MCDKDALQARHVAFKIKNNGIWQSKQQRFPIEFKQISPFVMEKARIQRLSISRFKEQLYPTLQAKQDMSDFAPYLIFPGMKPV